MSNYNRDGQGRFSGGFFSRIYQRIVWSIKVVLHVIFTVVKFTLIVGAVTAIVIAVVYFGLTGRFTKAQVEQPKQEDTFNAFFERKVEAEKNRPGFKSEMDAYADRQARTNVMHGIITLMEQKVTPAK